VVFIGLLLSIIGAYLKGILDKIFQKVSSAYRKRKDEEAERREKLISMLREDKHEQIMHAFDEIRSRIRSNTMIVMGFIFSFDCASGR